MARRSLLMAAVFVLFFFMFSRAEEGVVRENTQTGAVFQEPSVLMALAHKGFRDEEYQIPRSIFEENGIRVTVASSDTTLARGMLGLELKPDLLLKDARIEDYDCLIFVGGVGAKEYWDDEVAHSLAKSAVDSGKVLAAICIAPVTLARAGVLESKKATVFKSGDTIRAFEKEGVIYTGDPVTVSGRVVTGRDPEAATEFARSILGLLPREPEVEEGE